MISTITKLLTPLFLLLVFTTGCTKSETCEEVGFVYVNGEPANRYGFDDNPYTTDVVEGECFESVDEANEWHIELREQGIDAMFGWEVACE